ncbi:hypothetical protein BDV59DRAFT_168564 [Aspergillus ambiguus]|uniref:uncharacterized protein n=1 Tax=Aspergillus ambiguus TaxID=176160 RepID=UPI003CCCCE40
MMSTRFPQMTSNSPKRKREPSEDSDRIGSFPTSPSTSSLLSVPELKLREDAELGRYSPRAVVAGRLGELAIRGDHLPAPPVSNDTAFTPSAQTRCWSYPVARSSSMFERDPTKQTSPPASGPSESAADRPAQHRSSLSTPTSVSPHKTPTPSPRKKRNPQSPSKPPSGRKSPPLTDSEVEDPLTWHDSEITGYNPSDPNDDGYGINGIGFKPTAAMAWARSQKRQKQVADWRSREAREAREKRRERRDGMSLDRLHTVQKGAIQKKVKFDV